MRNYLWIVIISVVLTGCGAQQSGTVNVTGLGAGQYTPAVLVFEGNEAYYSQALAVCRQAAANRQNTASQEGELETITNVTEAATVGAVLGTVVAPDLDKSSAEGALLGAAVAAVLSVPFAYAEGTRKTANQTKFVLLKCLHTASDNGNRWEVLEECPKGFNQDCTWR